MPLPKLDSSTPYSAPPVTVTQFNELFMTDFSIHADPSAAWTAIATLRNWNYDSATLAPESVETVHKFVVADLRVQAGRSPLVGQVLGGVLTVIGLLNQEEDILRKKTVSDQLNADLAAQLNALQTSKTNLQTALDEANALPDSDSSKEDTVNAIQSDLTANAAQIADLTSQKATAKSQADAIYGALAQVRAALQISE